jgi:urease accessory protein UreE
MKQATILAVFIAVVSVCIAAPVNAVKNFADTSSAKVEGIHEMLQEILIATGLQSNFELKEANVLNIEASVSNRKRYILYNPSYITSLNNITKDKWAVMALLAHEIGHHLNGHTMRKGGSTSELELQADEFAGFILHKLGATLQESQSVMHHIAKAKGSKTHPSRDSRLFAIEKGWSRASGLEQMKDTAKQ